jgi:hypothetical protein
MQGLGFSSKGGKISFKRDSCPGKEKQKRKNHRGGNILRTSEWCTTQCATIWRDPSSAKLLRRATRASMGGGAPVPKPNYVVPNVNFAEPYAQYPQPQQSMAIIGGYVAETPKTSQPSKPTRLNLVRAMQILPMSLDAFT